MVFLRIYKFLHSLLHQSKYLRQNKQLTKFSLFEDKTKLKIVAEDLGFIDEGVKDLMKKTGYPGMKILEFAFDGNPDNEHKPSNTTNNYCVYTGTHDNMPLYQHILDQNEEQLKIMIDDVLKTLTNLYRMNLGTIKAKFGAKLMETIFI